MTSKERIAYLEGLLEGLKVEDEDTRRVYEAIVEALRALSSEIEEHEEILTEQQEFLGELADSWSTKILNNFALLVNIYLYWYV
jgi:hypothetical protein